ncbi:hypothetical protein BGZ83_002501, partial [Gryganskiella cystojenkinii]
MSSHQASSHPGASASSTSSSTGAAQDSNIHISVNPLQHRPHTPLRSSFQLSDHPSDHPISSLSPSASSSTSSLLNPSMNSMAPISSTSIGIGTASNLLPSSNLSSLSAQGNGVTGESYETISTAQSPPSLLRSFSKSGRRSFMDNEKYVGSLPTIHHQNGRGRHEGATVLGVSLKHLSLLVLLLQNSVLVLMMRYSRVSVDPDQPMYLASTAVFLAEIIKLCTCFGILTYRNGSVARAIYIVRTEIFGQPQEIVKMLVPSGLYALQNNLLYIALSNLEAATFQVTYQLKILSTAIFSVVMLHKRLTRQKWLSLCLLMLGVTLVQLQNVGTPKSPISMDSGEDGSEEDYLDAAVSERIAEAESQMNGGPEEEGGSLQNPIIGLLAVLTSCVSSGFAGCYFEKILKGSESDMWVRNLQLGVSGSLFSFLAMFYDRHAIYEGGMFQGYSWITWFVITNQALGGLLVAVVVKYADNILKGFATSLSIIISGMISVYFFDFEPSIQFQLGTLVVILATFLYGRPDAPIPGFVRREK